MTGINHALTGAVIAAAIDKPLIALPAALLSHFVVDAIPHWNYKVPPKLRKLVILFDLLGSVLLVVSLSILLFDSKPWQVIFGGFLGILPDAMWLPQILEGKPAPMNKKNLFHAVRRFHAKIQWSETAPGGFVEIAWFFLMLAVAFNIIR
jgi:hypothetical protein